MQELSTIGVTEMTDAEMQELDGGIWIAIAVGLVALAWSTAAY
jgi:lactobin A/cerein 7B family class IIb bacteriocin